MKRLMFTIASIIMALPMLAQYDAYGRTQARMSGYADERNIYYGLRLGMGISTVNSDDSALDGGSSQTGLNLGAVAGFQLAASTPVYLETGLFYTEKGGKGYVDNSKFTYNLNYLEIPIIVKYRYSIDDRFSVQPFAGGYIAFGVGGKVKNYSERETSSSFSENYFKRFDGGLKIGCGAEYQMIYAELVYDWGLANICHSDFDTSRTGCFYINCGVNF